MLKDVIGEILEAEKKADETIKNAEDQCRRILEEAGARADSLVRDASALAMNETKKAVEEAQKASSRIVKEHEKALEESLVSSSSISDAAAKVAASDVFRLILTTAVNCGE